jgi:DCN1-like protein 1/2
MIKQFRAITNATQNDASRILKQNGYRLEASVGAFYSDEVAMSNATKGASGSDRKAEKEMKEKLGAIFDQYKGESGNGKAR